MDQVPIRAYVRAAVDRQLTVAACHCVYVKLRAPRGEPFVPEDQLLKLCFKITEMSEATRRCTVLLRACCQVASVVVRLLQHMHDVLHLHQTSHAIS
jgi:hypothetical protein